MESFCYLNNGIVVFLTAEDDEITDYLLTNYL